MFKLSTSDSFTWPVEFKLPADGGKFEKHTFDAVFKHYGEEKIQEMLKAENASDKTFAKEVLVGWKGITDDKNAEVPYSESAKEKLLDIPVVGSAISDAYLTAKLGGEAKRKNL